MTTMYVYLDPVIDTEEDVLAIRATALAMLKEGKTVLEWTGEGVSSKKAFVAPVFDILAECRHCLKQMNPQKYGYIATSSKQFRF